MLDIKFVRSNADDVINGLRKRRSKLDLAEFLSIDQKRRDLLLEVEELKASRNQSSGEISRMKKTGENAEPLLAELTGIDVVAGHFKARHFRILDVGMPEEHPDYDLWVTADAHYIVLRATVTGYMQTAYELSSYTVVEH